MSIHLGKNSFTGPIKSIDKLKDKSGIYAIVCMVDGEYFIVDVGEGSKLRTRIENNFKKDCWIKNCAGLLTIYVRYTRFLKLRERILIIKKLREIFHPDCEVEKKVSP